MIADHGRWRFGTEILPDNFERVTLSLLFMVCKLNAIVFENLRLDLLEIAIERTSVFTVPLTIPASQFFSATLLFD